MKVNFLKLATKLRERMLVARWEMISVKSDFTDEHHLPETLPVPRAHRERASRGDFSFDEAMEWMKRFINSRPRHAMCREFRLAIRKGDVYRQLAEKMDRGRWLEVDELGRRLAEIDPLDPSGVLARGRAMRRLGQLGNALRFYQDALKIRPIHSTALPEFASACRAIGQPHRFEPALDAVRRQLGETHPLTIESRVQLGELVRVFADPTDPATVAHVPRRQYIQNVHMRLEEMDPDPESTMNLGRTMLQDEMPELARMLLARGENLFGPRPLLAALRGMIQRHDHDLPAAEQSLRGALADEDHPVIRVELAETLGDQARQPGIDDARRRALEAEAQQQLRLAIDRDPDMTEALNLLVEPMRQRGVEAVAAMLEPLAGAYPRSWGVWKVLGDAYLAENRPQDALKAFELGLARQTSDALLLGRLHTLALLERTDELLSAAKKITHVERRDPVLRWNVAQAYCQAKRIRPASRILDSIVKDEDAAPPLRQRAKEILLQLRQIEGD